MTNTIPTRSEIQAKFTDAIPPGNFPIVEQNVLPNPETLHQQGVGYQYLGTVRGWRVWLVTGVIIGYHVVCQYGAFRQGAELMINDFRYAATACAPYVPTTDSLIELGQRYCEIPATSFAVTEPKKNWKLPPDESAVVVYRAPAYFQSATATTTTTTAGPEVDHTILVSPGSGLVPYSNQWQSPIA